MIAALALLLLAPQQADSIGSRLAEAQRLESHGRRAEARARYEALVAIYNRGSGFTAPQLTAIGTAAERLSAYDPKYARDALRLYDEASRRDPASPEPRLRAAALLLARYNGSEAGAAYEEIHRRWPRNARAMLGIAEVRRFLGDGDPVVAAESSVVLDPDLAEAHVVLARFHLEGGDFDGAAREATRALVLDPRSQGAFGVRAALTFLRNETAAFQAVDHAAMTDDPRAASHLVFAADAAARARRYRDAVTLAERAVARDSTAWHGWAVLGVNRLRLADMAGGRTALETALRGDPFDLWTKNTLDLLDQIQKFPETSSPRFRFYMDGRESAILSLYFAPLAEAAYETMAARYGIRPPVPVRVEVFTSHADFSVRTVGLAGMGALGVCFGPVIAMDSPSARDRGQFNWGSTLWHEIAHTFHLALSDSRVPRWLTEGLAVLEERRARSWWGAAVSPEFLSVWSHDSLPKLSHLNDGFSRPSSGMMLAHAYFLASLAAEYIESVHGADVTPRMLAAYARNLDQSQVTREVLGIDPAALDARFDAWMRMRYASQLADLGAWAGSLPSLPRARALAAAGDSAGALRTLVALTAGDESAYDANLELAGTLERADRSDEALAALERALYISPLDPALHERLAAHYARLGRHDDLIRERQAAIALNPADRAGAWYRLAQAQASGGRTQEARRSVLHALEIAPGYADAQDLLIRLTERP